MSEALPATSASMTTVSVTGTSPRAPFSKVVSTESNMVRIVYLPSVAMFVIVPESDKFVLEGMALSRRQSESLQEDFQRRVLDDLVREDVVPKGDAVVPKGDAVVDLPGVLEDADVLVLPESGEATASKMPRLTFDFEDDLEAGDDSRLSLDEP